MSKVTPPGIEASAFFRGVELVKNGLVNRIACVFSIILSKKGAISSLTTVTCVSIKSLGERRAVCVVGVKRSFKFIDVVRVHLFDFR